MVAAMNGTYQLSLVFGQENYMYNIEEHGRFDGAGWYALCPYCDSENNALRISCSNSHEAHRKLLDLDVKDGETDETR